MNAEQVKDIISRGENHEIEFKESFHSTQTTSKIICALANTLGGILFFGVDDKGSIIGINENPDKVQQKIANSNQAVFPVPLISVELHEIDQKKIIAIVIQRAPDGTYYTFQGAIYVKIGSTIKRLEGQTQLNFLKNRQILSFDESYDSLMKIDD
ncbi:MAG: ATP-binding protein, partial [archaeon]|nr:ATP-binding protein [archaeon]